MPHGRERAWDTKRRWCGEGAAERRPALDVDHQCGRRADCGRFICDRCERCMPWCRGVDDSLHATWCDECLLREHKRKRRVIATRKRVWPTEVWSRLARVRSPSAADTPRMIRSRLQRAPRAVVLLAVG
jgi:hypothetical protein